MISRYRSPIVVIFLRGGTEEKPEENYHQRKRKREKKEEGSSLSLSIDTHTYNKHTPGFM
jgi:hypothetical protein